MPPSGTPTTEAEEEKLNAAPALLADTFQIPGVGSNPVMEAVPKPSTTSVLTFTYDTLSVVASKL